MKRYFTVQEANRQLPLIEPLLISLQQLKKEIAAKHIQLQAAKAAFGHKMDKDEFFVHEAEVEFLLMQANHLVDQVQEHGAEVKSIDLGLIDFYTEIDGKEAYLCWKLGEPLSIRFWHGLHEGFPGRKPICEHD
ncbi:DUF2203 domain-containing protein [Effusibacillus dendaii]|nr:DUF2203 domain-containing protein [Effusibacillus dendaii]